jgi:uncharacterized NAD-dependent epimerase/dehydratase family protein
MIVGKRYVVKTTQPYFGGKAGLFEFMGGPKADVVVLCHENNGGHKHYICVDINDIEKQED